MKALRHPGVNDGRHCASAAAEADYILATASTGGTYYPWGGDQHPDQGEAATKQKISMSAINSAGWAKPRLIREREADFAILQGLYGYYGYQGVGPVEKDGPQTHLRSVSMLWQNVEHYIVQNEFAKRYGFGYQSERRKIGHGSSEWAPLAQTRPSWVTWVWIFTVMSS